MPKSKPLGWPRYMVEKQLRGGPVAYYWRPPTWAGKQGCAVRAEALGCDYGAAKKRCDDILNPQFDAWRTKGTVGSSGPREGTFDWLAALYKTAPRYTKLLPGTRADYDDALALVSKYELTDGRKFGTLPLGSITPGAADRLFAKLCIGKNNTTRARTAVMCIAVAKVAWNVAFRDRPDIVPPVNPFAKIDTSAYVPKQTRPVTPEELSRFVEAADAVGEPSIGTAAMIAFYWLQRQVDILNRLQWTAYRPKEAPETVTIFHHKTGANFPLPLFDEDGTVLWPELMARLDAAPRHGTLIVTRDKLDRNRKVHLPWRANYFRHRVADIRAAAGIDAEAKFMGLRHGGNTAAADAELTDAQLRALSGHRTASMTQLYAKQTKKQRQTGARKMLEARTKRGNLSE